MGIRIVRFSYLVIFATSFLAATGVVHAFNFTEEEAKQEVSLASHAQHVAPISVSCRKMLKEERVTLLIAERGNNGFNADQNRYAMHFLGINRRLQKQGMRTFSQEEIKKRVAQAEIDAYFRNDPDAALGAAKKFAGTMVLRGVMSSRRSVNPVLGINEVAVNISFALVDNDGHGIAEASASSESYSGSDTVGMALTLINEQADGVISRLISGYCAQHGGNSKSK